MKVEEADGGGAGNKTIVEDQRSIPHENLRYPESNPRAASSDERNFAPVGRGSKAIQNQTLMHGIHLDVSLPQSWRATILIKAKDTAMTGSGCTAISWKQQVPYPLERDSGLLAWGLL